MTASSLESVQRGTVRDRMTDMQTDTFVIGDIHGCAGHLEALLAWIGSDFARRRIIFLGDLIDRGEDSRRVLEFVRQELSACDTSRLIMGNHEELMLAFLDDPKNDAALEAWKQKGGSATLASFGLDDSMPGRKLASRLAGFPELEVLASSRSQIQSASFMFVHAGVRPGVPLDMQDDYDLRWIREPFLSSVETFRKVIVHGHTPTDSRLPEVGRSRVNLDTGSFRSGRVAAMHISADEKDFEFLLASSTSLGRVTVEACLPSVVL